MKLSFAVSKNISQELYAYYMKLRQKKHTTLDFIKKIKIN
jgi:hypothetical protein